MQSKQAEWHEQWSMFHDSENFLFEDWIFPNIIGDFNGKEVLECGCGCGQHTAIIAPHAKKVVAVDLNTTDIARARNQRFTNVTFLQDDIAEMDLKHKFDIVFSIGVVHHTNNPDKTIENLKHHVKDGGRLIIWVYSKEGNFMVENIVEPIRKVFLSNMSRKKMVLLSKIITFLMYIPIYSIYLLPLKLLPYYDYFENFRRMSFDRNGLNVFDKLNAPQVELIDKQRISRWFNEAEFEDVHISAYKGVSWRGSGTKKCQK